MNAVAMIRLCALRQANVTGHYEGYTPGSPRYDPDPVNHETLYDVADHGFDGVDRHHVAGLDDAGVPAGEWE